MAASSTPSIAIVGAGPGGLLLARYLQLRSIRCIIYEREASRAARGQGGSLDLHEESGLLAMRETGLFVEFEKYARMEGEEMRILDKTGKVWLDEADEQQGKPSASRPEIDRRVVLKDGSARVYTDFILVYLEPICAIYFSTPSIPTRSIGTTTSPLQNLYLRARIVSTSPTLLPQQPTFWLAPTEHGHASDPSSHPLYPSTRGSPSSISSSRTSTPGSPTSLHSSETVPP